MIKSIWPIALSAMIVLAIGCAEVFDRVDRFERIGRWETLGRAGADSPRDRDSLAVSNTGRFRQLRLEVQGGPIELHEMVVTFGDGTTFSAPGGQRFDDRSPSRVIDLPGDRKTIQKVDFVYSPVERDRGATVIVYGR